MCSHSFFRFSEGYIYSVNRYLEILSSISRTQLKYIVASFWTYFFSPLKLFISETFQSANVFQCSSPFVIIDASQLFGVLFKC